VEHEESDRQNQSIRLIPISLWFDSLHLVNEVVSLSITFGALLGNVASSFLLYACSILRIFCSTHPARLVTCKPSKHSNQGFSFLEAVAEVVLVEQAHVLFEGH